MTPAELAAYLRTSERTVARMVADGCPSLLVGRRRRFDLAAVLEWTRSRGEQSQAAPEPGGRRSPQSVALQDQYADASRKVRLRVMVGGSKPR